MATARELRRFTGHTALVGAVAFSPDGLRFLSASDDRTLRLWNAETGQMIRQLTGHTDAIYGVTFSPDGRWALSCGLDGTVRLWGERR
jgi:WD40 repeat protein